MVFPLLPSFESGVSAEELKNLSVTGSVLLKVPNQNKLNDLIAQYSSVLSGSEVAIEFTESSSIDAYIAALNNGVLRVIADIEVSEELKVSGVSEDRIIVKIKNVNDLIKYKNSVASPEISLEGITVKEDQLVYVDYSNDIERFKSFKAPKLNIIPILNSSDLSTDDSKVNIADVLISYLNTDRADGLFTSLITNESNQSLGLVYSSKESIKESIKSKTGVYQSRKRKGLWKKGETSGNIQELVRLDIDCDGDCLKFIVYQRGLGFCHLNTNSCFGDFKGLSKLEIVLQDRLKNAPEGSYTKRLFNDEELLVAKIKEEAEELTDAQSKDEIAWEAADLFYFSLVKCIKNGVALADVEKNLDKKHLKVTRRKGDAKEKFLKKEESKQAPAPSPAPKAEEVDPNERIVMNVIDVACSTKEQIEAALKRPIQSTANIMKLVNPIIDSVKSKGDAALLELTAKFDGVTLPSPVINAPFEPESYAISDELKNAIDLSIENVEKFHRAQLSAPFEIETQPGVKCSRFARPIESVGCYIPGGTAILPSTSIMLGVPAKVAGCKKIVFASPPQKNGKISPEVAYVAHKLGVDSIVLAGGAQAVAAMAYGTESISKVDKILGPGNQFVTAAKMYVANDSNALCSIDMPAGPSEVLVIADNEADPDFVASDLLSQAEHGIDSQVILIGVSLTKEALQNIENSLHEQALKLPRVDIIRKCIKHSTTILVSDYEAAFKMSNEYAPEHLILQIQNASSFVPKVFNAGSVFVGAYSPESLGDYSSGTNHTLPTYGYAKMYSGVNTSTFQKFITSQDVTPEGLNNIGREVMSIAKVEGLDGHRNAVKIRMEKLGLLD